MSESGSALGASSLENLSTVCGAHSLAEAVLFFSLKLLRLICSKHLSVTPFPWHLMTLPYIINIFFVICQEFFTFKRKFSFLFLTGKGACLTFFLLHFLLFGVIMSSITFEKKVVI